MTEATTTEQTSGREHAANAVQGLLNGTAESVGCIWQILRKYDYDKFADALQWSLDQPDADEDPQVGVLRERIKVVRMLAQLKRDMAATRFGQELEEHAKRAASAEKTDNLLVKALLELVARNRR